MVESLQYFIYKKLLPFMVRHSAFERRRLQIATPGFWQANEVHVILRPFG
jgi:hypothetical protein